MCVPRFFSRSIAAQQGCLSRDPTGTTRCPVQGSLTPSLLCCDSGNIDNCGVCDGDGSACEKTGIVSMSTTASSLAARKLSRMTVDRTDGQSANLIRANAMPVAGSVHARHIQAFSSDYDDIVGEFKACMCMHSSMRLSALCTCRHPAQHCPSICMPILLVTLVVSGCR